MMRVLHARLDGTFVIEGAMGPYHVEKHDALYAEVAAAAEGLALEPEPVPEPFIVPPVPPPTKAALMAKLLALQTQIEAFA